MEYDGYNSVVLDAEESDWLDVSYAERKYVNKKDKSDRRKFNVKINKRLTIIMAAVVLSVALLAAVLFIDGNFSKDVFGAAKAVFSSTVFNGVKTDKVESGKIEIPCNVSLVNVENGVATFNGGKAALSFADGKVSAVTEDSVTVTLDEKTAITYQGLTAVFVAVGDTVSANSLLGKYDGVFTASITESGEAVTDVMGTQTELVWNV